MKIREDKVELKKRGDERQPTYRQRPKNKGQIDTQQTRSCSQRQIDVGEGNNTLLLIPLLLCCEEHQFPF